MTARTTLTLGVATIGFILVGYSIRVDDDRLRLVGIAFLAAAWLLRFLRRRPGSPTGEKDP